MTPTSDTNYLLICVLLTLWALPWKCVAVWKAAKNGSKWWFVILLVANTVGILEILYIFIFSKCGKKETHQVVHHHEHHTK